MIMSNAFVFSDTEPQIINMDDQEFVTNLDYVF